MIKFYFIYIYFLFIIFIFFQLISALTDTLKAYLYSKPIWTFDKTKGVLEVPDPFYFNQKLTEDRNDYEITGNIKILISFSLKGKKERD